MKATTPRFPLYIPSKGRWQPNRRLTSRALEEMGVPYLFVVEEQEYADYAREVGKHRLAVLDKSFQRAYETCDALGETKSKGPGPARNFAWHHARMNGHDWHWVMDDNIRGFTRLNRNFKVKLADGTGFRLMEDFVLRYTNVGMAGPNYDFFCPARSRFPPFVTNTRIYSCNLIRNDLPYRWRGRYNEDTILSLDMIKAGWCTIQFNAFLQLKVATQTVQGGNTAAFYAKEGTLAKSRMLVEQFPEEARLVHKFGRWHHEINYRPFQAMKLKRRADLVIEPGVNEYGMKLKRVA